MWDTLLSRNPAALVKSVRPFAVLLLVLASGSAALAQLPATDPKTAPPSPGTTTEVPQQARITITVNPTAATQGEAAGAELPNATTLDAAVKPAVIPHQVRAAAFEARDELVANVRLQMLTANRFMADLSLRAMPFPSDVRYQYQMVLNTARQRTSQLGSTLQAVQAAPPDRFPEIRNHLAEDYAAYAATIAQLDAIVAANTAGPP